MQKLFLVFIMLLSINLFSEAPSTLSWQGVISDDEDNLLDGTYNIALKLYNVETGGTALWTETQNLDVDNGYVNIILGEVTALNLDFDEQYWLEITIDSGTPLNRVQLNSVPYAMNAKSVEGISSDNISDWNTAYGWGDHAEEGYITEFTETDPTWSGDANTTATIYREGNLGLGTTSPTAILHTSGKGSGEGNILFEGLYKATSIGEPPASGEGTRFMWYPDKAALRAGHVIDVNWDKDSIGQASIALGWNTKASGDYSTALGLHSQAIGTASVAIGFSPMASGLSSVGIGRSVIASGNYSFAIGYQSVATGEKSFAIGDNAQATGESSFSFGNLTSASGALSLALGYNSEASGISSTAIGRTNTSSGYASTSLGASNTASGDYSFASGRFTESTGNYSIAMGYTTSATDFYAVAIGDNSDASGESAFATGRQTNASGTASFTSGGYSEASGEYSSAMGYTTEAAGDNSIAIGSNTKSQSFSEVVVGSFNTDYTPASNTNWNENDRLFVVGNGQNSGNTSNALTILKNGNTGIGTDTPTALLHTRGTDTGEGNVLFEGEYKPSDPGDPPAEGAGTRMMWYPDKAAFRVGQVTTEFWDKDSIGTHSFASGYNTKATGDYSTALGRFSYAEGYYSTAMSSHTKATGDFSLAAGYLSTASGGVSVAMGDAAQASGSASVAVGSYTEASGNYSFASGKNSEAMGDYSVAMGNEAVAKGWYSFAIGNGAFALGSSIAMGDAAKASGNSSVAIGPSAEADGYESFAFGNEAVASGTGSTSIGNGTETTGFHSTAMGTDTKASGYKSSAFGSSTLASGRYSTAIGYRTEAKSYAETVLGLNNTDYIPNDTLRWDENDRLFVVGNGEDADNKSNALTILKDGNTGIGTDNPSELLHLYSGNNTKLRIAAGSDDLAEVNFYSGNSYKGAIGFNNDNDYLYIYQSGNIYFRNGRIGLNTVFNPSYAVHITNTSSNSGGKGIAYEWVTYSDGRLKSEREEIGYGLNEIMQLQPLQYFHHHSDKDENGINVLTEGTHDFGFIAQDIYKILPEVVSVPENETSELWGMNYEKLTPVLVKAMQEQQQIIEEQNKRIEELEEKNKEIIELKKRLDALEKIIK